MSYYQGDYYQGDYYRGGFLSIFKKIGAGVGRLIGVSGGTTKVAPVLSLPPAVEQALARIPAGLQAPARSLAAGVAKHPVLSAAAAAGVAGIAARGRAAASAAMPGTPAARSRGSGAMLGGRRRRRMNPYNPRALRRAVRRAHAFSRMAKKILRFTSPRPPKGHAYFRHKRRKRV